jgi:hypothetical protein
MDSGGGDNKERERHEHQNLRCFHSVSPLEMVIEFVFGPQAISEYR